MGCWGGGERAPKPCPSKQATPSPPRMKAWPRLTKKQWTLVVVFSYWLCKCYVLPLAGYVECWKNVFVSVFSSNVVFLYCVWYWFKDQICTYFPHVFVNLFLFGYVAIRLCMYERTCGYSWMIMLLGAPVLNWKCKSHGIAESRTFLNWFNTIKNK